MTQAQIFVLVNVFGGISVLGSYLLGLVYYPELRMNLWGGVDGIWKTIFSMSMLPAAAGYLLFFYYMVFKSGLDGFEHDVVLLRHLPSILCAVFLISASVWMPSTLAYLSGNSTLWWNVAVVSLWITAISLLLLTLSIAFQHHGPQAFSRTIATIGLFYITFHCIVLDGIIWIYKFPKSL